jgi:2-polyprenyl-3-methyl-5-hydroxy-6-metoxy-1,4-benzoquinol methylase
MTKRYFFEEVLRCQMCGIDTSNHKVLGQRLNQSQGLNPYRKNGISVSVKQCNNCGLIYSSPQPIPFDIQDHYGIPPDSYWKQDYFQVEDNYFSKEIEEARSLLVGIENPVALDIGAGLGKAMIALKKRGFDAFGFEPSKPFYEKAITTMKIDSQKLRLGAVEEMDYPKDSFDFITYGAVFEHLYHPAECLQKSLEWLKPGGIVHIEVPSSRWLISRMVNMYYRLIGTNYVTNLSPMHVPFHLYEFHLKSFDALATRLGCEVVKHRYEVCQIPFVPAPLHFLFRTFMSKTNTGMQLTVYLKKK